MISHSSPIEAHEYEYGKKTSIKQRDLKDFIYGTMENDVNSDVLDYYSHKYKKDFQHLEVEPINKEKMLIEITPIQNQLTVGYTHLVKIKFFKRKVIFNQKQKIHSTDTLIYHVNVNNLSPHRDVKDQKLSVKLIKYIHQE
ncbi:hypothetical protein Q8G32_28565 [Priestia megaterium]|uniref:hypothetical protein n=1 Tax=Priestia megaterium TaxID=1404 RepID=UPI00273052DF|nr:hypothetical protein [Priestia megaterium]MDP1471796.1 hypothetical protein [Priestia megaterium]